MVTLLAFMAVASSTNLPPPSAPHPPIPPSPRRKILCLHGGGGDGAGFRTEIAHIEQSLSEFEFVFVDAPTSGGLWVIDPPGGKGVPTTDPDIDSASYLMLDLIVALQGPFYGILGYSQGSMYTVAYLAHSVNTFQMAIMFCGYLPETHIGILNRISSRSPFSIPAYVFMGVSDSVISNTQTNAQAAVFPNATVVVSNDAGHHPPLLTDSTYQTLISWVSDHSAPAPAPPPSLSPPSLSPSPGGKGKGDGGDGGGGDTGDTSDTGAQLTCSETQDYTGNPALAGTPAALLGSVACVDQAALAYRQTLDVSIAGSDRSTVNIYGPFEAGFTNTVPGLSCLGANVVDGGIDTYTAQLMVRHLCNDNSLELLQTCGDHANPRHFHEYLERCLSSPDSVTGHSSRIGTAGDGLGVYGPFGNNGSTPHVDACGAAFGVTPDSNGIAVPYYSVQSDPPFFVGCYTNNATTTLEQCNAMYSGCSSTPVTITTSYGSGPYRSWCPCWNDHGSNAGENSRPAFWEPLQTSPTYLCIQNYWPLFTQAEIHLSNSLSPTNSSHPHTFDNIVYFMPDGFSGNMHNDQGPCPPETSYHLPPSPPPSLSPSPPPSPSPSPSPSPPPPGPQHPPPPPSPPPPGFPPPPNTPVGTPLVPPPPPPSPKSPPNPPLPSPPPPSPHPPSTPPPFPPVGFRASMDVALNDEATSGLSASELTEALTKVATEGSAPESSVVVEISNRVEMGVSMPDDGYMEQARQKLCEGIPDCNAQVMTSVVSRRRKLNTGFSVTYIITIAPSANASLDSAAIASTLEQSLGNSSFAVSGNTTVSTTATVTIVTTGTAGEAQQILQTNLSSTSIATAVAEDLGIDSSLLTVSEAVVMYPPRPPPLPPPQTPFPPPRTPSPPPPVPCPPPSSPPQHPSPPPTTDDLAYSIHFTITAAGTVEAFHVDEYKASLSTAINMQASMISINVTAASVRVASVIHATSTSIKDVVVAVLQPLERDMAAASTLLGVAVESVDPVTTTLVTVSPPPAPPPDKEDDSNENMGIVLIVGIAIAVSVACGISTGILLMPRRVKVADEKLTLLKDAPLTSGIVLPVAPAAGFAGDGEIPILSYCKS